MKNTTYTGSQSGGFLTLAPESSPAGQVGSQPQAVGWEPRAFPVGESSYVDSSQKFQEKSHAQAMHSSLACYAASGLMPLASEVGVLLFIKHSAFNPLYNPRRERAVFPL